MVDDEELLRVYADTGNNQTETARRLGVARTTIQHHLNRIERDRGGPVKEEATLPVFPDSDIPPEELKNHMVRRFKRRWASQQAHNWFDVSVSHSQPIGLLFFGDPHVDDDGCDWKTLDAHCDIAKTTPGIFGVNVGDTTNNWAGRLASLYAKQDASASTARQLAEWFMLESGVNWLVWILGNHDAWGDGAAVLDQMAKRYKTRKLVCHDWEARFQLCFKNGATFKVWVSHDFKGHSQWNPLHGPMKAGQMSQEAHLYVAGHKHNHALMQFENAARGIYQTFVRVRGYKMMDDYARKLGIIEQKHGHSSLVIFDPSKDPAEGGVYPFEDVAMGAEFLTWLRSRS